MMNKKILLCLALCGLISTAAFGQGFSQGDNMFNLYGSGASDTDLDTTNLAFDFSWGHFFTENIAAELRQGLQLSEDELTSGSSRIAVDWYFEGQRVWPFIGANLGYAYGDFISDTWIGGPEVGLKWFVNETTYILGMVEYQFFFDEAEDDDGGAFGGGGAEETGFEDGQFVYSIGIGFKF